jgi:hypothetical protein
MYVYLACLGTCNIFDGLLLWILNLEADNNLQGSDDKALVDFTTLRHTQLGIIVQAWT